MTQVERLSKFQANDFILDVGINPKVVSKGDGGSIALLSAATLPAVRTHKIALAVISLEPCGVNRPHIHPRGTEAAYIVKGKNITMGFAPENGGKVMINNAGAGFASFFPQGYIHFQANNDCEPGDLE
ncbi:RmlC-like cupin domain-containing protein [Globomyces pollinis-pini]|nr:RmlC-like cupin domain-containing protein [Globomyces pollinis-pini]